jgi:acetyl esterase/lipase
MTFRTIAYGPSPDHVGDLYLPRHAGHRRSGRATVVALLHGGFWRMPYGRDHIAPIAVDLADRGFAVWNLEYRRIGTAGGGWPGTLQDVGTGIDHLATLAEDGEPIGLDRVMVVGHSAGGHLALWCALQDTVRGDGFQPRRVKVSGAVGLAAVADLALAHELRCGNGAVENFLGGSPGEVAARYRSTSPAEMLPIGVKQLLVHGSIDIDVPVVLSRRYAAAATAAGDDVDFIELADANHMDFIDPSSDAHAAWCSRLTA